MRNRGISQSAAVEKLIITEDYLKLQWNLRCGPSSNLEPEKGRQFLLELLEG